jgi:hypothetical protein
MIKIDGSKAKIHWLSNNHNNGLLTKDQAVLYIPQKPQKLGQVTRDSAEGLTPQQAFEQRYSDKSLADEDVIAEDIFVIDKLHGEDYDYDDPPRIIIHDLYLKGKLPFDALYPGFQLPSKNTEALINYNREEHLNLIVDVIKQSQGIGTYFDTKDPITWRFQQEDDIQEISKILNQNRLCLYAAYTSRGKTKIGIEVAVRLCQQGGIVLVTTPITDTKKSFEENISDFHFGYNRNLKITYMDSVEFAKHKVNDLRQRANNGELIFVVLTVQDLRYGELDVTVDADVKGLRDKYHALSGSVNLWVRDERHAQYNGEITSQRLAEMVAEYELDLTATPYNVLDKYDWEQIVSRTLLWGLKYKEHTKLPIIRIDAISTPLSSVSPKVAAIYSEEEGFDPRKLFIRNNGNFVLEAELLDIRDRMYHNALSKNKNPLSIVNDTELSSVAKTCGFWVLPEGQDGDGAADYIPDLANLLNTNSKTYFTDSYTLEKECPKNTTIGKYIESLVQEHGRVVILTCGKFLTGTDIPILGHIVLLSKMNNIANFEQLLGRMIREHTGKDEVKMYCFAPAMEIGLVQGKMAKMNVALNSGSEYELLECIPLTEYTENEPRRISPDTILAEIQEFFKRLSKDRLPQASLETALSDIDISVWETLDTKKFKRSAPKSGITDDNGSRVKDSISTNPKTGKPRTKDEINKLEQIATAIQTVMVEAKWIAYSIDNYNYADVLGDPMLAKMFPDEIDAVVKTIENDDIIKQMVIKNLKDKQLAYKGLGPKDVYDDIFMNNDYKRDIGLVYVSFDMAKELVGNLPENIYNNKDIILVPNALNGTIPLMLRERFPLARIICGEHFEYFRSHLERLGFETFIWEKIDMKFDIIVGNSPYQKPKSDSRMGSQGSSELWPEFVNKGLSLLKDDGYLAFIHPNSWRKPEDRNGFWKLLTKEKQMEKLVMSSGKGDQDWFGIGVRVDYYILQNKAKYKNTIVVDHMGVTYDLDLANFDWLPNYAIDEISNLLGTGTKVLYNTFYHTQKVHSDTPTKDYKYPVVHTINKSGLGIKYFDKLQEKDTTHYGVAKVLLNQNELQYPHNDHKGEYGMSQLTFGIAISSEQEGEEIIKFLNSDKGKRLIAATKWNTYYTDYGMFKSFKKHWYK